MFIGLARFVLICSFAAWGNVVFARALWQGGTHWYIAGLAGIMVGSAWNLSVSSRFTWGPQQKLVIMDEEPTSQPFTPDLEASR